MIGSKRRGLLNATARSAAAAALLGFTLATGGCGQPASSPPAAPAAGTTAEDHSHDGADEGHADAAGDEVAAALAKLSPEDRTLAEAQKVCVVSKGELGSMGTPIKVEHNGKAYFLCCEHCREAFEKEPDKLIAELPAAATADTAPAAEGAVAPATEPAADSTAK